MIVCSKCGFTQPKDVYCANCGINIETYQPVKPPTWIALLKDPYFQISSALIVALASFFVIINQPSTQQPTDQAFSQESSETTTEIQDNTLKATTAPPPAVVPKSKKKAPARPKLTTKKAKSLKVVGTPVAPPQEKLKAIVQKQETFEYSETSNEPKADKDLKLPTKALYQFYEVSEAKLASLFKVSTATVEVVVVDSVTFKTQSLGTSPLSTPEKSWNLATTESMTMNYMTESLDDSPQKGIRFTVKINTQGSEAPNETSLNVGVKANIPSKEGAGKTLDWSRSFKVTAGQFILVKIKLPHFEVPVNFLEESYNNSSPLSILSSPQFLEQKTQLLGVLKID